MSYCIYTGALALVQDVNAENAEAKVKMTTFLRALNECVKTNPIVQRSIDIINNALRNGSKTYTDSEKQVADQTFSNCLPAFPYGDVQSHLENDKQYGSLQLDGFSMLDSFPEFQIDGVSDQWNF